MNPHASVLAQPCNPASRGIFATAKRGEMFTGA